MITTILIVFAFVLFFLAAIGVGAPRFNLVAGGLACYMLSILLSGISIK